MCVFEDRDRLFLAEGYDSTKKETFYRPLGGAIEFGQRGSECVVREIREEMGAEIKDLTYLDTIENIFTYDGQPGHEIVSVYQANFVDYHICHVESVGCRNSGEKLIARWKPWLSSGPEMPLCIEKAFLTCWTGRRGNPPTSYNSGFVVCLTHKAPSLAGKQIEPWMSSANPWITDSGPGEMPMPFSRLM